MNNPARKRGLTLLVATVLLLISFLAFQWKSKFSHHKIEALTDKAETLYEDGQYTDAEQHIRQALQIDNRSPAARLLAAKIAISQKDYETAILDLEEIVDESCPEWYPAQKLFAEILHNHVFRFREAEQIYRRLISAKPDDLFAHENYARLLGLCGRRQEAIPHILTLIRAGEETDLLVLLSRESSALNDPQKLNAARKADPTDPNPILGLAHAEFSALRPDRALELLRTAESLEGLPIDFQGRVGQCLLASAGHTDELQQWIQNLPARPQSFETWIVLGKLSEQNQQTRSAIRCYWEAVKRHPESLSANSGLAQAFIADNQSALAKPFLKRMEDLNQLRDSQLTTIMSSETSSETQIIDLLNSYWKAGRLWEAHAWGRIALIAYPRNQKLQQIVAEIKPELSDLPLTLTKSDYNPAHQIDFSDYPLPTFNAAEKYDHFQKRSTDIAFRTQTHEVGFEFEYYNGGGNSTYRMFEFTGGGIAALDYDRDGDPDLMCTQGREWDQSAINQPDMHDHFFRNQNGIAFENVTHSTGISLETGFGQGLSAGDINNDGFADLYAANTGQNTLWINNGDGTFTDRTSDLKEATPRWTTSCLIADINGDSYPDLYDVNYLTGEEVFDKVCRDKNGKPDICEPKDFSGAKDCLWLGDGTGAFTDATKSLLINPPDGKGLGIVAIRSDNSRLSVFVANDTVANHFYTFDSPQANSMSDNGLISGLAFNGEGKAEACMGIAAGDCNQDGNIDFFVTNFLYESNTLYANLGESFYKDQTQKFGLQAPSLSTLGFGTQFLDANLDGRLELFVANGYTHDLSRTGTPYAMPPHLFEWTGEQFDQWPADKIVSWGLEELVGRAVTRLDWNNDGLPDLVVGRLDGPSFLMTNQSQNANKHLTLELISTQSARDAIGSIVNITIGESNWVYQLTAGDGYQCSNERKLVIGCGENDTVDRLQVIWPNGVSQEFFDVPTSQSLILIEGEKWHSVHRN